MCSRHQGVALGASNLSRRFILLRHARCARSLCVCSYVLSVAFVADGGDFEQALSVPLCLIAYCLVRIVCELLNVLLSVTGLITKLLMFIG